MAKMCICILRVHIGKNGSCALVFDEIVFCKVHSRRSASAQGPVAGNAHCKLRFMRSCGAK